RRAQIDHVFWEPLPNELRDGHVRVPISIFPPHSAEELGRKLPRIQLLDRIVRLEKGKHPSAIGSAELMGKPRVSEVPPLAQSHVLLRGGRWLVLHRRCGPSRDPAVIQPVNCAELPEEREGGVAGIDLLHHPAASARRRFLHLYLALLKRVYNI